MTRPEPLLTFSDYSEDFKARIQIHNYEFKKLCEDVSKLSQFVSKQVSMITDKGFYNLIDM